MNIFIALTYGHEVIMYELPQLDDSVYAYCHGLITGRCK